MKTDYPRGKRQLAELCKMLAVTYDCDDPISMKRIEQAVTANPDAPPPCSRIISKSGKIVAHVGIRDMSLRIGRSSFRMGGLAYVGCHPDHRRKGLASQCIEDSIRVMRDDGMRLSVLFGIPDYYSRFGYVGCLPEYKLRVARDGMKKLKNRCIVDTPTRKDAAEILRLYEAASAATPGAAVRDRARLAYQMKRNKLKARNDGHSEPPLYVFRDRKSPSTLRAYAAYRSDSLIEAAMEPGDELACESVLAWLRKKSKSTKPKEVVLSHHCPAHPLWKYATRFDHSATRKFEWDEGGMGLILDVKGFLEGMAPEFERRIDGTGIVAECHLHMEVDDVRHSMVLCRSHHITNAAATVMVADVKCSKQSLLQLCLGTFALDELRDVEVSGTSALVNAIFRGSSPTMYLLDHF